MQNATVVITEKPATAKKLAPVLATNADTPVYAITTYYVGLYEFQYPRGLRMRDYPRVSEPEWKARSLEQPTVWEARGEQVVPCNIAPDDLLKNAQTIIFACDPDHSGVIAFDTLLTQALGANQDQASHPALLLTTTSKDGIQNAMEAMGSTRDNWFATARNAGLAKKFFDYNFNANALVLLGAALRKARCPVKEPRISKYGLQLLYSLRDEPAQDTNAILQRMESWKGTGRYAVTRLGSAASMTGIIDDLRASELIEDQPDQIGLTDTGYRFLECLHPDCRDPDLPARLQAWMTAWPDSKPAMARYLRTFFGKQKRFA